MHLAIKNGELNQVKSLVESNSELLLQKYTIDSKINNFMPREVSPLFDAVLYSRYEIVEYFIKKGVDLTQDNYAIYMAVLQKKEEIKELLVKNGARISNDITPHLRPNILTQAVWIYKDIDILKELIDLGAPVNVDWGVNGNYTHSPLGMATRLMLPDVAKLLVENGAKLNLKRNNGQIGLHDAVFYSRNRYIPKVEYSPELLIYLLKNGGDTKHKDINGDTPFEYAAIEGVHAALKILWDDEYDVTQTNIDGMTLLHRTIIKGYLNNVEFLISKGFNLNAQDNYKNTPLFYADKYGHSKIAELLKSKGGKSDKVLNHDKAENILNRELKEGQAYIWYLGRQGWAIKTKNNLILKPNDWGEVEPDNPSLTNGTLVAKELYNQNILIFDKVNAEEIAAYRDSLETVFPENNINLIHPRASDSHQINSVKLNKFEKNNIGNTEVQKGNNGNLIIVVDDVKLFFAGHKVPENEDFLNSLQNNDISFLNIWGGSLPVEVVSDTETKIEIFKPKMIFYQSLYTCSDLFQKASNSLKARECKVEIPVAKFPGDCFFYDASKLVHLDKYYAENEKISGLEEIKKILEKGEFKDVVENLEAIIKNREKYYYYSAELNTLGYEYLREAKNEEAIKCFKWNVLLFPDHYNVYDSLGEAYAKNGNIKLAIQSYKKAYEINPNSIYLKQTLESLENKL
jgi:ankyrin repeat protein